jgi:RNA polymerase sigma-70 factor (ECF subfamily)
VLEEESLVRRAQAKDAEAFVWLYEAYFDKVYRYVAVRIGNALEAEDITQDVFLKALNSISSYRWQGVPFLAWLYRIARNKLIDRYRKKPAVPDIPLDGIHLTEEGDPVEMAEIRTEIERVMRAAKKLTEAQQEVIALRFIADLSIADVAQAMSRSQGAVKALQHSALEALRRAIASGQQ